MKALIATALILNISFASVDDDYLSSLKQEVLKTNPDFKTFDTKKGEEIFKWWKDTFGDDFYVELNRHNLADENHVNEVLMHFAKKHHVKYFAANNNYYLDKNGFDSHDILLCVKDGEKKATPVGRGRGFRYGLQNKEFYFKSPKEMLELFNDMPEAIEATNEIVDKIEQFKLGRDILLPKFEIAADFITTNE